MEFDELQGKYMFSCEHCGHSFNASPPDQVYTFAMAKKCFECDVLGLGRYVTRNFECENCHKMTHMNWHVATAHSLREKIKAKEKSWEFLARRKS